MAMSEAAKRALTNAQGTHIGATVIAGSLSVFDELVDSGMLGRVAGLTRKGSIEAMKLKRAEEDRLFPL